VGLVARRVASGLAWCSASGAFQALRTRTLPGINRRNHLIHYSRYQRPKLFKPCNKPEGRRRPPLGRWAPTTAAPKRSPA
jgi:hypothetical protein